MLKHLLLLVPFVCPSKKYPASSPEHACVCPLNTVVLNATNSGLIHRYILHLSFLCLTLTLGSSVSSAQSALDGFDPGLNGDVKAIVINRDGKILIGGAFTTVGIGGPIQLNRERIARLNADGSVDSNFISAANNEVSTLAVQDDGKILLGGLFSSLGLGGIPRFSIGRLHPNGSVDQSFDPGANGPIFKIILQADGKILVGGGFTTIGGGGTGTIARNRIARLNPDGSVDLTFNAGANGTINSLAQQRDGRIVAGGQFSSVTDPSGSVTRNNLARFNPDGTVDSDFNSGASATVRSLAVQQDGKIVLAGDFAMLGGGGTGSTSRNRIGRLNPDGAIDATFDPGTNGFISVTTIQADGKILVGGSFSTLGGGGTGTTTRNNLGRLNPNGTIDGEFNRGADSVVHALAVQDDDKIILGGHFNNLVDEGFTTLTQRFRIGRIYANGIVDTNFNPGSSGAVRALSIQADGKILIGGFFNVVGGSVRRSIARVNQDGLIDPMFDPGASGFSPEIVALAVQPDGKILVGGGFSKLGGGSGTTDRNFIGRLNPDGTVDMGFNPGANGPVQGIAIQPDGKILVTGSH